MDEQALALAQALFDAGRREYAESFQIPNSDEVIVVYAIRTNRPKAERLVKAAKSITETKAVSGSMGLPCPACGGSGRI